MPSNHVRRANSRSDGDASNYHANRGRLCLHRGSGHLCLRHGIGDPLLARRLHSKQICRKDSRPLITSSFQFRRGRSRTYSPKTLMRVPPRIFGRCDFPCKLRAPAQKSLTNCDPPRNEFVLSSWEAALGVWRHVVCSRSSSAPWTASRISASAAGHRT